MINHVDQIIDLASRSDEELQKLFYVIFSVDDIEHELSYLKIGKELSSKKLYAIIDEEKIYISGFELFRTIKKFIDTNRSRILSKKFFTKMYNAFMYIKAIEDNYIYDPKVSVSKFIKNDKLHKIYNYNYLTVKRDLIDASKYYQKEIEMDTITKENYPFFNFSDMKDNFNLLVTGNSKSGRTTLITNILKDINQEFMKYVDIFTLSKDHYDYYLNYLKESKINFAYAIEETSDIEEEYYEGKNIGKVRCKHELQDYIFGKIKDKLNKIIMVGRAYQEVNINIRHSVVWILDGIDGYIKEEDLSKFIDSEFPNYLSQLPIDISIIISFKYSDTLVYNLKSCVNLFALTSKIYDKYFHNSEKYMDIIEEKQTAMLFKKKPHKNHIKSFQLKYDTQIEEKYFYLLEDIEENYEIVFNTKTVNIPLSNSSYINSKEIIDEKKIEKNIITQENCPFFNFSDMKDTFNLLVTGNSKSGRTTLITNILKDMKIQSKEIVHIFTLNKSHYDHYINYVKESAVNFAYAIEETSDIKEEYYKEKSIGRVEYKHELQDYMFNIIRDKINKIIDFGKELKKIGSDERISVVLILDGIDGYIEEKDLSKFIHSQCSNCLLELPIDISIIISLKYTNTLIYNLNSCVNLFTLTSKMYHEYFSHIKEYMNIIKEREMAILFKKNTTPIKNITSFQLKYMPKTKNNKFYLVVYDEKDYKKILDCRRIKKMNNLKNMPLNDSNKSNRDIFKNHGEFERVKNHDVVEESVKFLSKDGISTNSWCKFLEQVFTEDEPLNINSLEENTPIENQSNNKKNVKDLNYSIGNEIIYRLRNTDFIDLDSIESTLLFKLDQDSLFYRMAILFTKFIYLCKSTENNKKETEIYPLSLQDELIDFGKNLLNTYKNEIIKFHKHYKLNIDVSHIIDFYNENNLSNQTLYPHNILFNNDRFIKRFKKILYLIIKKINR